MASTAAKYAKLKPLKTTKNFVFPSDLMADGQDTACVVFYPNWIKGYKTGKGDLENLPNTGGSKTNPYGDVPILHTAANNGSLLMKNGGIEVFTDLYSRSDQSIALPIPTVLSFTWSVQWQQSELGRAAAAIDQISSLKEQSWDQKLNLVEKSVANTGASVVQGLGVSKAKDMLELATGTIANTYDETLFKGVNFRMIPFSWTLTPRSAKEAQTIETIIRLFRYHMLPDYRNDVGNGNAYLAYPSTFDIAFFQDGKVNPHIPRVSTVALTNMSLNGTPNGAYFPMVDGAWQSCQLDLTFVELQQLSKSNIQKDAQGTSF